jgi:hypothetical protein
MTARGLVIGGAVAALFALGACGASGSGAQGKAGAGGHAGTPTGASGGPGAGGSVASGAGAGGAAGNAGSATAGAAGTAAPVDADTGPHDAGAGAPDGAPSEAGLPGDASGAAGASAWPAVTDYGAAGPFPVARDVNTGPSGAYDVFRPATLGGAGRRHPIVSWANGTLFPLDDYKMLLQHWASHGFVVIAGHANSTAGGGTHKAGIDWLVAENARAASPYFGVLDTAHVGAAGHSQGGGATIAAGAQKPGPLALTTTLPLMPILSFESDTSIVGKQTAPMFNINATMDTRDPTGAVANQIYAAAKTELVQAAFIGVHEDAMGPAMLAPTLAWFRLKLMADAAARPLFYPPATCGLCRDPAWKQVRYQNTP